MTAKQQLRAMEKSLLDIFQNQNFTKKQAIDTVLSSFALTPEEMRDNGTNGKKNILKSRLGEAFAGLCRREILVSAADGVYSLVKARPVIIHEDKCEVAILALLKEGAKTRAELSQLLAEKFGTNRTATKKDDARLSTAITTVLARLSKSGVILKEDGGYSLCKQCTADPKCVMELAALRADFLARVHSKGGEFFEHYFMNLLEKYVSLYHKTVLENTTVGGSEDGGIDGILRTRDCLGFEETVLVQTKNRRMTFAERDMRGFYGAVRAEGGSRGIFATTGLFHEGAQKFLDSLPDLIGIDGYKIFEMAVKTLYGIKKSGGTLSVDARVLG